jgi:hypothetical protein
MGVENLNRFHWILIGAILGVVLAWSWASTSHHVEGYSSSDAADFERDVIQKDPTGRLLVSGIIVHPPEYSPVDGGEVNRVTYKRLAKDRRGRYGHIDKWFVAKIPYTPAFRGRVQIQDPTKFTVETYLAELAKNNEIDFRNGWYLKPHNAMMIGGAAGVVLVGGIWPTLLGLMTGAGLGPKRKPKAKNVKPLWQYKSAPSPATAAKQGPSAQEQAELAAVTSAYERTVGDAAQETPSDAPAATQAQTEVQQLDGGPLEKQEPIKQSGDDDEIEVKGVYYPVLIHHKKGEAKDDKSDNATPKKDEN